ncbi:unnamed protein product, partial [Linum tenue]
LYLVEVVVVTQRRRNWKRENAARPRTQKKKEEEEEEEQCTWSYYLPFPFRTSSSDHYSLPPRCIKPNLVGHRRGELRLATASAALALTATGKRCRMKTSLKILRGALHKHNNDGDAGGRDGRDLRSLAQLDELASASQDMQDMRECYDSLLSAAAATANSAYEFSESLREMGACLLEKTALNDDEESGKVLLMMGKAQFELQKLVDAYRAHVLQTITVPSDSLLNELQTVEEMKQQCDEKREMYEYMRMRRREKGRARSGKGGERVESFSVDQVQAARDRYDEEATLFVFRLKSLKQGQSRSLLTQAARHHAAQMTFFKKALKALEEVEPHVKSVTAHQFIDYHFAGLDDEDDGEDDDDNNSSDTNDDGELSFQYDQNDDERDVSTSRDSMVLDGGDLTFPKVSTSEARKENFGRSYRSYSFRGDARTGSQSAPLFAVRKSVSVDKLEQLRPSFAKKFSSYVLPTPNDPNGRSPTTASSGPIPRTFNGGKHWSHSNRHDPKKYEKLMGDEKMNPKSALRESNNNNSDAATRLTPPMGDGLLLSRLDPGRRAISDFSKTNQRQAFSGPIARKSWPSIPSPLDQHAQLLSGPLLQTRMSQMPSSSPTISPSTSPTLLSSPRISELHELPRPPRNPLSFAGVGHSAPLSFPRGQAAAVASPLPVPSQVSRSLSIPSGGQRAVASVPSVESLTPQATQNAENVEEVFFSPPLTPLSPLDGQPMAAAGSQVKGKK